MEKHAKAQKAWGRTYAFITKHKRIMILIARLMVRVFVWHVQIRQNLLVSTEAIENIVQENASLKE